MRNKFNAVALVVNALELKEWVDKNINMSPEVSNWSLAYDMSRCFPGLQNVDKLIEYVIGLHRRVKAKDTTDEGKQLYEEIDADTIIEIACKVYEIMDVAQIKSKGEEQ